MKSLKIVIIAQWVLPMRCPRSQRTWNLALRLAEIGHDVTVYALLGKTDYSEYESRYGLKIRNLGKSRLGCVNSDGDHIDLLRRGLGKFLGRRFCVPTIELSGMAERVVNRLDHVDLLITIAFPHPIHWGAARAFTRERAKCWIADCGDPFMGNPFAKPARKFEAEERNWCSKVDAITIPIEEGRTAYYEEYREKIAVVPQGFDFSGIKLAKYVPNPVPTFAFSGQVYPGTRDMSGLMKYLLTLDKPFRLVVYTKLRKHFEPLATKLGDKFEFRDYVPREQLIYELSQMDFLINVVNKGTVQQPSKLIDYGQAGRPVLDISTVFTEKDSFDEFFSGNYRQATKIADIGRYDIKVVAQQFIDIFGDVVGER